MGAPNSLDDLSRAWLRAKADEQAANTRRLEVEAQIIALTGKRDEGAQTTDTGAYKLTITGKVSRKMDWKAWENVKAQIPPELHPVKLKPELDERGVKWLAEHRVDLYALLPLTVTPAKTAVEVREVAVEVPA